MNYINKTTIIVLNDSLLQKTSSKNEFNLADNIKYNLVKKISI